MREGLKVGVDAQLLLEGDRGEKMNPDDSIAAHDLPRALLADGTVTRVNSARQEEVGMYDIALDFLRPDRLNYRKKIRR